MKRAVIIVIILALVSSGLYFALGREPAGAPGPGAEAANVPPVVRAGGMVVAEGKVVPVRSAELSLPAAGRVADVSVLEGDPVQAGQVLVRLEAAKQAAAVGQAEAEVRGAAARLAKLHAGARPQEIAAAQAVVETAQAQLAIIQEGARPEEIAAAEAEWVSTQAALQKTLEGPTAEEKIVAKAELKRTEIALQKAQAEYDPVAYRTDVGALPQAAQLQTATVEHEKALATYNQAVKDATPADIAAARAQVAAAASALAKLRHGPTPAEVAAAEAEVRRTQAQLDLLRAGERTEATAEAEAGLAAAQASLQQAQATLAETELRAPFAGVVASLNAKVGEQVAGGAPIARVADLGEWQIETKDLTELGVVDVQIGSPVTLTVDAIPGLVLSGTVSRIKGMGETRQGDIVYTVLVKPDRPDARLRWNMTTSVNITPAQASPENEARGSALAPPENPTATATATAAPTVTPTVTPAPTTTPPPSTRKQAPGLAERVVGPPAAALTGKLVFQTSSGGDINIVNADGSGLRRLTTGLDPAWSPDGRQVAFARWEGIPRGLFAINADGAGERLVYGWDRAGLKAPAWSPDGQRLAFTFQTGGDTRLEQCFTFKDPSGKKFSKCFSGPRNPLWKVASVAADGAGFRELLCHDFSYSPSWSVDGRRIAYSSDQGLFITGEEDGMGRTADDPRHWMITDRQGDRSPAWSPDGHRVAFQTKSHDHWEIAVINDDGQGRTQITRSWPLADTPVSSVSPAWSPDGRWIAYLTDARGRWELWRMRPDGSDAAPLLEKVLKNITFTYDSADERVVSWGR